MFAENEKIYRFEQHALAIDLEKIYGVYIVNLIIIMIKCMCEHMSCIY